MINCLILDDEQAAINVLTKYIEETPYLKLVDGTTSVSKAIEMLSQQSIDLIFLDIQMPLLNGLQFIDLYGHQVKVVLTTAYSEYALEGYDRNVIDYLLKPIPFNRFLKAAEKALNYFNRNNSVLTTQASQPDMDFILVKTEHKGKLRKINFNEIVYVEGLKNYVSIYTTQQERIVTYSGISDLEERLPSHLFARVHRSYIVTIRMITAIDGNEVLLKDAPRIPISGKFKDDLLLKLQKAILQNKSE
ncbi:LytTR family DNA-binding domain-containing protein [Cytophagaceae bacterium DM2B3-1]|uniref:LytTR family DNA-binding domain-containing protein n=1 Tax=Xanthocytophaga flava TaxID=3048013 RepID=A0ABT7CZX8_9BACT|nr:LytTR family DNA-binding domain-containing protein [Xanthocytophaga flavus]MDJ1466742.1 LytTR family DNA-binding domain-containing protein [Xanthocytophaga flavus]MDJ1498472.1 LytTR family DNA-binding domain-containing protein [Xanthocytophaga flavus]